MKERTKQPLLACCMLLQGYKNQNSHSSKKQTDSFDPMPGHRSRSRGSPKEGRKRYQKGFRKTMCFWLLKRTLRCFRVRLFSKNNTAPKMVVFLRPQTGCLIKRDPAMTSKKPTKMVLFGVPHVPELTKKDPKGRLNLSQLAFVKPFFVFG